MFFASLIFASKARAFKISWYLLLKKKYGKLNICKQVHDLLVWTNTRSLAGQNKLVCLSFEKKMASLIFATKALAYMSRATHDALLYGSYPSSAIIFNVGHNSQSRTM